MRGHVVTHPLDMCNTCEQAGACVAAAEALAAEQEQEGAAAAVNPNEPSPDGIFPERKRF